MLDACRGVLFVGRCLLLFMCVVHWFWLFVFSCLLSVVGGYSVLFVVCVFCSCAVFCLFWAVVSCALFVVPFLGCLLLLACCVFVC